MSITIYGSSDDLIEVEGDVDEEFYLQNDDGGDLIALSNGCVFRIAYSGEGIWRITPTVIRAGVEYTIAQAVSADSDNYTDRLKVVDGITWVAHAVAYAGAPS